MDNTYGSVTQPSSFGSGNGNFKGGGIVHIKVQEFVRIDGTVNVDGSTFGGSGGSICIKTNAFSGQGQLSAKGGNGNSSLGMLFFLTNRIFLDVLKIPSSRLLLQCDVAKKERHTSLLFSVGMNSSS